MKSGDVGPQWSGFSNYRIRDLGKGGLGYGVRVTVLRFGLGVKVRGGLG